ncbi:uroporphyrinogen-III synthase [Campylobacter upsaliensis]|nr:uroporphyrinogen-III synthase [Campylobacter upsaliensis]EDP6821907.1 uroporphyrinogen-III synthase [Campylobacter upsaliensis]
MKIYLLNEAKFKGVENLILNEIKFFDFNVNLKDFNALILTSKNAVKALERAKIKLNFTLQIYAVGEKTAKEAKKLGFTKIKIPSLAYGKTLFDEFKDELKGQKCLYLRGKNIASKLNEDLQNYGVKLKEVIVYENVFKAYKIELKQPAIFILTSPHSVLNFLKFYKAHPKDHFIAIGQSTAKNLKGLQFSLAKEATIKACVDLARLYKTSLRQD